MFEEFAPFYDNVYAARGKNYPGEAARLVEIIAERFDNEDRRRLTLLDVACGTGEHLLHLQKHFDLQGLDESESMLVIARAKLPDVPLRQASMTDFALPDRCDVVTCLFSSIGYLENDAEMRQAIQCMTDHLHPGGLLIVEPAVMPDRLQPPREQKDVVQVGSQTLTRITNAEHGDGELVIHFQFTLEGGARAQEFEESHRIQLFARDAYERAFEHAGLSVEFDPDGLTGLGLFIGRKVDAV